MDGRFCYSAINSYNFNTFILMFLPTSNISNTCFYLTNHFLWHSFWHCTLNWGSNARWKIRHVYHVAQTGTNYFFYEPNKIIETRKILRNFLEMILFSSFVIQESPIYDCPTRLNTGSRICQEMLDIQDATFYFDCVIVKITMWGNHTKSNVSIQRPFKKYTLQHWTFQL